MVRLFLSHASPDKPAVRRIASALRAAGHEPWFDEDKILVGQSIPAAVERGLRDADFVVICLSKAAADRGWIEAERDATLMQQFRERKERILPVRLEEVAPPHLIAPIAYVDLFPDEHSFAEGIGRLTRSIQAHEVRNTPHADAHPTSAQAAASRQPIASPTSRLTSPGKPTPTPAYASAEVQALSERLEHAHARKQTLRDAGIATEEVDREILELRRRLREGAQLRAGDALGDGRYLLIKPVGRGGFAVVWEAFDRAKQRRVAIKVLHQHLAGDPQRPERFFRGARIMMGLEHPAVVRVYDPRGEDDGFCYFAMELAPGGNLRDAVLGQRVQAGRSLTLILQVAEALAEAHRKGLVHRDIKPSNVLLDEDGNAKLTDFDLVGAHDTTGGTHTGALGTVVYAAPECLDRPHEATARADVFGLGMTTIFCLSGKDLSMDTFREPAPTIAELACSVCVRRVLEQAVAWKPDHRFADASAMVDALRNALDRSMQQGAVEPESAARTPSPSTAFMPATEHSLDEGPARTDDDEASVVRERLLQVETERENAEREARIEGAEAMERPRLQAALEQHPLQREMELRRARVANHALHDSIEQAAAAWERMRRPRDHLWGRRQLVEARALDRALLAQGEAAFLAAGDQAIRRKRIIAVGAAAVLVIGAVSAGLLIRAKARREIESMVADQTRAATAAQLTARQTAAQVDVARGHALGLFDAHRWNEGDQAWADVEAMALREEREYRSAFSQLETALLVDPRSAGLRGWAANLMFERLVRAERSRRRDLVDEFASRLFAYDDGRYKAELGADATVQLSLSPEATQVWVERDGAPRAPVARRQTAALSLSPGSVVLSFEAPGHVPARLPILLARGETLVVRISLPRLESAPRGMIYVPPGRFLFGSADGYAARRGFFNAAPLHEVWTDGYFIGRYEVTFGEWIEFLNDLPAAERRERGPQTSAESTFMLTEFGPQRWRLTMALSTHTYTARTGEQLRYLRRARRAEQDWTRFPVSAVSYEDAIAYTRWLDRTGRLPGARLCDEYEWERAARGADGRTFPSGNALAHDDANIDVTYGREPLGLGPDEVGSHPRSRSPVGADDMAGNVWEWTRSVQTPGMPVLRGGSWYLAEISARSMNREYGEPTTHNSSVGVRLCATLQ